MGAQKLEGSLNIQFMGSSVLKSESVVEFLLQLLSRIARKSPGN